MDEYWQQLRSYVDNDFLFFNGILMLLHSGLIFGLGTLALVAWKHQWWQEYKIQPHAFPSPALIRRNIRSVVVGHFVVAPVALWFLWPIMTTRHGVERLLGTPLPSLGTFLGHLVVCMLLEDLCFYWTHRTLHAVPFLYRHVHKQHHEFTTPTVLGSEYAHPVEMVLGNYLPFLAGPLLLSPHAVTQWAWLSLRLIQSMENHCGYAFPYSPFAVWPFLTSAQHDFHHKHNQGCYGSFFVIWDTIMGTDQAFWKWKNAQNAGAGAGAGAAGDRKSNHVEKAHKS